MEDVLDVYTAAYDDKHPLICMDEASKQLLGHGQEPLPARPGRPAREDYHYERRGVEALFLFFDPVRGWRRVSCRDSRMRVDWAEEVRRLLEEDYPEAEKVTLVCDNLNTHGIASLYEAFPAAVAHRLARRLEIHYTPRHGSWLNVAEIELSVLSRQCLDQRIGTVEQLEAAIQAWQRERNAERCRVHWRFTTDNARIKLAHLYPQFKCS
jgi:DDE superfamily endonuclease